MFTTCTLSLLFRWFGIVLLPVASFSANAIVAITFFIGRWLKERLGKTESPTRASSSYSSGCRFSVGGPTIPCQCSSVGATTPQRPSFPAVLKSTCRSIRSRAPRWHMLPCELCYGRDQDQLCRGRHPDCVLRYDCAFLVYFRLSPVECTIDCSVLMCARIG
jgi:hypothetical protein